MESVSPQKQKLSSLAYDSESSSEIDEPSASNLTPDAPNPQDDKKYIVFANQLSLLWNRCPECGAIISETDKSTQGTLPCATLTCINHHEYTWQSQPMLNRMAAGNLLLSSSILLTGATYTRMAAFADILRLQFMSEKTFGDIQREYLFPAINDFWLKEQDLIFEELGDRDLWLSADGRCDSHRYNAKYRAYTMLDQHTDKVIDFKVVQVSEVTSSNAMDREGFQRCMTAIEERGAKVKVTDGHIGIVADMRKDHPDKDHQLDVWHFRKRINIKLTEKAKKDCAGLFPWIKSISNHFWWCAETC